MIGENAGPFTPFVSSTVVKCMTSSDSLWLPVEIFWMSQLTLWSVVHYRLMPRKRSGSADETQLVPSQCTAVAHSYWAMRDDGEGFGRSGHGVVDWEQVVSCLLCEDPVPTDGCIGLASA